MALEGAYAFDVVGATTVADLSGNGRDITLSGTNGAQVDSGGLLDGGALGKTGVNAISLPAALRTACETDDRTLMFDGLGGRSVWWVRWESTALNAGVWGMLSLDAANITTRARDQANGNPTPVGSTVGALSPTVRHNFAITYVRSTGVLSRYYDGALIGIQNFPPGTALYVGADDLNIAEWNSAGPAIDNLRFLSHALTDAEIAALAGTPVEEEPEPPPEPMDAGESDMPLVPIMAKVTSVVQALGVFETVNGEINHVPGAGLRAAVWPGRITSPPGSSGLAATSVVLPVMVRIYGRVRAFPVDEIDEEMLDAVDKLCAAYIGQFTLGGLVRGIDIRGRFGQPLTVEPGYLDVQEGVCRVQTLQLPLIINDMWNEVA